MTFEKYYQNPDLSHWQGRVDNEKPERIHQWITLGSLLNIEKLQTGRNISFLGFACDEGVRRNLGRVGAKGGPRAFREAFKNLCVQLHPEEKLWDMGDIFCPDRDLEACQKVLGEAVYKLLAKGHLPFLLGGGHETSWGHYLGLREKYPTEPIGIINLDAHFDLRSLVDGHLGSSGTPFWQIAKDCQERSLDFPYACIGVQRSANTDQLFKRSHELGVQSVLAQDIHSQGLQAAENAISKTIQSSKVVYLTICLDVFASAYAPGVSAQNPTGLTPQQVWPLIKKVLASGKVVGVDLVELSPTHDSENQTAKLAAQLAFDIVEQVFSFGR